MVENINLDQFQTETEKYTLNDSINNKEAINPKIEDDPFDIRLVGNNLTREW
jgi:hypothetical protein